MVSLSPTLSDQDRRMLHKTQDQQLIHRAMEGAGLSRWEASVLPEVVRELYFRTPNGVPLRSGQTLYECVAEGESAGKPMSACKLVTVVLTTIDHDEDIPVLRKEGAEGLRCVRILRLTAEAREQGGVLSQEDLGSLLSCDVRTVRRSCAQIRKVSNAPVETRGTVEDIGPGVTHKALAVRHWMSGKEPVEVARAIHHTLRSTERYLQNFIRVVYLHRKRFELTEIALTMGISTASVMAYLDLYREYVPKEEFRRRWEEIDLIGATQFAATDAKKGANSLRRKSSNGATTPCGRQP
jgi:hypothetical protein